MEIKEFAKQMQVKDLVAVHLTRYFPENGVIRTLNTNYPEGTLRNTIHFTLNHPVENVDEFHGNCNWDSTKYAIVVPLENLCKENPSQLWNFNVVDTYFIGDIKLPRGTQIISKSAPVNPTREQFEMMKKNGIEYAIGGKNLRQDTYHAIREKGYEPMPGGMWAWGDEFITQDQKRIASELEVIYNQHHGSELADLEDYSHYLLNMTGQKAKTDIQSYLTEENQSTLETSESAKEGREILKRGIPQTIDRIKKLEEKLPKEFRPRIDKFLKAIKKRLTTIIPEEISREYNIAL